MTKILLINIPAGPFPTDYPPVAISRVMDGIDDSLGCEASFFNLDLYRPAFDEIAEKVREVMPDIIGISAMLTPTYGYLKKLSNFLGERFPDAIQVVGGQMNVIANIILLKTRVKFCVIGESEPVFSSLIRRLMLDRFRPEDMEPYTEIKNLVFLKDGRPLFTGYGSEDAGKGVRQFNYKRIAAFSGLENYIHRIDGQYFRVRLINSDVNDLFRIFYPENLDKNMATAFTSKGCVNRCTFCHRFTKGYKVIGNDDVISYIEDLKKEQNVGMVIFSEENFGNHKKSTAGIIDYLKTSGLNWAAPAVRVRSVNEEILKNWKEAGCVHVNFGIESLSQKILNVMEKNSTVEENLNAIRLCNKYRLFTVMGLVIGMPGETEETIEETLCNLKTVIPDDIDFPFEIYINFVQAIPGTPVYEYARRQGLIGKTLEDEERYIESLQDVDANEIKHYLNFTDYEKEELAHWKYYITMELICSYIEKHGYLKVFRRRKTRPYRIGLLYSLVPRGVRKFALKYAIMVKVFGVKGMASTVLRMASKTLRKRTKRFEDVDRSLRKINQETGLAPREDDFSTAILRESR